MEPIVLTQVIKNMLSGYLARNLSSDETRTICRRLAIDAREGTLTNDDSLMLAWLGVQLAESASCDSVQVR